MSLLAVAALLWTFWPWLCFGSSEIHVTCVFSEVCVLPCQFTKGRDEVIHWNKGTAVVHSFYYSSDQLGRQDPAYKNRTSMDKEQVAEGNASLSLWGTKLQDGGTYKCYCSTAQGSQESRIIVEVKAPVRSVDMKVHGEEVHCSSQNIYPKPHVSWATDPPTRPEALQATTESLPDSVGLFTLESEVAILGNLSDYTYICSISLEGTSQLWTASLKHQGTTASTFQSGTVVCSAVFVTSIFAGVHVTDIIEGAEGQALSIPCHAPNDLQNFTLTWAFMTTEQPSVFLSFSSWTGKVANNWTDRVQLDPVQVQTGDGSLQLENPQGQEKGTFICTFSNEYSRHTVYTSIRVTGAGNPVPERLWAVVVFAVIAFIIILTFIIWRLYIHFCSRHAEEGKKQQSECQQEQQTKNDYQLVR